MIQKEAETKNLHIVIRTVSYLDVDPLNSL